MTVSIAKLSVAEREEPMAQSNGITYDCSEPFPQPQASNPQFFLPDESLYEIGDIITDQEANDLANAIDKGHFGKQWSPEGYDRRHRVQRYYDKRGDNEFNKNGGAAIYLGPDDLKSVDRNDTTDGFDQSELSSEEAFGWLFDRIVLSHQKRNSPSKVLSITNRPFEVVVVEHTPASCKSLVKVFEQNELCYCQQQERGTPELTSESQPECNRCSCYTVQLTLISNAVQSIDKPLTRIPDCWDLAEPPDKHETDLLLKKNCAVVRSGESLWNWRGRISGLIEDGSSFESDGADKADNIFVNGAGVKRMTFLERKLKSSEKRCITITFRRIRQPERTCQQEGANECSLGSRTMLMPPVPLSKLLTVVVTTSPIRSHPSTEMLERTFATFHFAGEEFAYECRKVIVCDGCRVLDDDKNVETSESSENGDSSSATSSSNPKPSNGRVKITRKHANTKQKLRNGIATTDQAKNYREFKSRLRKLCENANENAEIKNSFRNAEVVELEERHGYGFALRHALRNCVNTPYVCVIQHDRTFMRPTPVREVLNAMSNDPKKKIKYVGMSMRSNLMYYDIFTGKFGRKATEEFKTLILRPAHLCIEGNVYGPDGKSLKEMAVPRDKIRENLEALRGTYRGSLQYSSHKEWLKSNRGGENCATHKCCQQLSLTPTLFWYDNTHIVETAHYRDYVFNPKYRMVARGGFVEDKLSPAMIRTVERYGLKDGHAKFGCYLLDDHSGMFFTGHLDGGSYIPTDERDPKGKMMRRKECN